MKGAAIGGAVGGSSLRDASSSLRDTGSSLRDAGSSLRDASSSLRATQGKQQKRVCRGRKGGNAGTSLRDASSSQRATQGKRRKRVCRGKKEGEGGAMRAVPSARHRENSEKGCVAERKKGKEARCEQFPARDTGKTAGKGVSRRGGSVPICVSGT